MAENLTSAQLQYVCRSQFNNGIPVFRNPFSSPEQIENAILSLRHLMFEKEIPLQDYVAVLRFLPGSFTAPEELSWFLGYDDLVMRAEYGESFHSKSSLSVDDFVRTLTVGNSYLTPETFGTIPASRFLLNSYLLLTHPQVMVTLSEVEANQGSYGIWEKKFPIKGCIEPVDENVLFGKYGKMDAAQLIESFIGMVGGRNVRLPSDVRKDLNSRLK